MTKNIIKFTGADRVLGFPHPVLFPRGRFSASSGLQSSRSLYPSILLQGYRASSVEGERGWKILTGFFYGFLGFFSIHLSLLGSFIRSSGFRRRVLLKMSHKEENRIFVGGLSWETGERRLEQEFGRFGKVLEAQVWPDTPSLDLFPYLVRIFFGFYVIYILKECKIKRKLHVGLIAQ